MKFTTVELWQTIMRFLRGLRPDAKFSDLPWQGWDDAFNRAIETDTQDCATAVYCLTQLGYIVTGVNRSARLLHINTPGRIALEVCQPVEYSGALKRASIHNMRNCTHGEREQSRH